MPTSVPISTSPTLATLAGTATVAPCTVPIGWITYTVQRGDSLVKIAQTTGTTVEALQAANCLANINSIRVGQILSVPDKAGIGASTSYLAEGCTDIGAKITAPAVGQLVKGILKVEGSATSNNFAFYKLEMRPDSSKAYTLYNSYIKPVSQGVLGEIDTRIFSTGIYWLKLTLVNQSGQATASCAIPILISQ